MNIYCLGVGGTAMGNLAILLQSQGYRVYGSDQKLYPPMSDLLAKNHIEIFEDYSAQRLEKLNPDLVIVGNVIARGNEEVEWLLNTKKISYTSLPEFIHQKVIANRDTIVVTGTHGKTTTTTLMAYLLSINGYNPGYFIGGAPLNFSSGACYGTKTSPFVIEGDEYDSAFFDKRSKFIHYTPKILIINNIELDHIDIFRDLQDIQRTFSHAIKLVPSNGCIIANGDSETIRQLLPIPWTRTIFVGKDPSNDFVINHRSSTPQETQFTLTHEAHEISIQSPLLGEHNMRNVAMAAVATQQYLGQNINIDLQNFRGIKKRQEVIFNDGHTVIMDDFAHHPRAIMETIHAVKQAFPGHRLITAFEPRSNTACSSCFQQDFIDAFRGSDEVYITEVFKKKENSLDVQQLASDIHYCPAWAVDVATIKAIFPNKISRGQQVFLFLSNGDFSGIAKFLKSTLV